MGKVVECLGKCPSVEEGEAAVVENFAVVECGGKMEDASEIVDGIDV